MKSTIVKHPILKKLFKIIGFIFLIVFIISMMCIPLYSTQRIHSAKITIVSNEVQQAKYMFGGQYYYINARAFILDSSLSGQIKICYSGDRNNSWTCARNHPETSDVFLVKKTFFSQDYGIYSRFMFQEGIFDKTVIWVIALGGF